MSTRPARAAAAITALVTLGACSGARHQDAAGASTTTLPPGTITADDWRPPHLTGPASQGNFCLALVAVYQHMGELPHVLSKSLSQQFIGDFVSYTPTIEAQAPADIKASAETYLNAVAAYLQKLSAAGLDLGRLPPGSLRDLSSDPVNAAYSALAGYSTHTCHYTIGGNAGA